MLKVRIIPCLDVKDGRRSRACSSSTCRCRRSGRAGARTTPPARRRARFWGPHASHENRDTIFDVVPPARRGSASAPHGGGGSAQGRTLIRKLLLAWADKVSIQLRRVTRPEFVRDGRPEYGDPVHLLSIDCRQTAPGKMEVFTRADATAPASMRSSGQTHDRSGRERFVPRWTANGNKSGFDFAHPGVSDAVPVPVIASGGSARSRLVERP